MPRTLIPENRHVNYSPIEMDGKNLKPEAILGRLEQGEQLLAAKEQGSAALQDLSRKMNLDGQRKRERMNAALLFGASVSQWPMEDVALLSWKQVTILASTQIDIEVRNALIELLIWSAKHPESPVAISRQITSLYDYCYGTKKDASHPKVLYLHARMREIQRLPLTETEIFRLQQWERAQHLEMLSQPPIQENVMITAEGQPEEPTQFHPLRVAFQEEKTEETAGAESRNHDVSETIPVQPVAYLKDMKTAMQGALSEWLQGEGNPLALALRRMSQIETTVRFAELERENEALRDMVTQMESLEVENSTLRTQLREAEENTMLLTEDLQHVSAARKKAEEKLGQITADLNKLRSALGMAFESMQSIDDRGRNV